MDLAIKIGKKIKKQRGEESIIFLQDDSSIDCERISTQCVVLDKILGGGMPLSRIVEVYGEEGCGKTTLALHILSEAQRLGGVSVLLDLEHSIDPRYAKAIGVNLGQLLFSQPNSGEEAFEIIYDIMHNAMEEKVKPLVIVLDSVAALVAREELTGEIGDLKISPVARLMSQSLRRIAGIVKKSGCLLVFTNQMRQKINTMWGRGSGSYSAGGKALKFYASVRLSLYSSKNLVKGGKQIGQTVKVRTTKNKTFPPFQETEFRLIWGMGIDGVYSLVSLGMEKGLIEKSGAWYQFEDFKAQGIEVFTEKIALDNEVLENLKSKVIVVGK